jgi:hypothetical protein
MATTFTGRSKIKKGPGEKLEPIDEQVAQAIYDLQQSATSDLKADLRDLYIVKAQEVDVAAGKKVHLVFPCDCEKKKKYFSVCVIFFAPSTPSFFFRFLTFSRQSSFGCPFRCCVVSSRFTPALCANLRRNSLVATSLSLVSGASSLPSARPTALSVSGGLGLAL